MENNTTPQHDKLTDSVLEKIRTGEIQMRSKTYFALKVVFFILIVFFTLVASSLLMSYIFFSVRASGQFFLLGFGGRGLEIFLALFPWTILIIVLILLLILEWLVRHFKFGYRSPLIYLLSAVFILSVIIGAIINTTPLHDTLLRHAEAGKLPFVGNFYNRLHEPPHQEGVYRGVVVSIYANTLVIAHDSHDVNQDAGLEEVIMPTSTAVSSMVSVGDEVFIGGTVINGKIYAYGLRKIMPEDPMNE